MMKHQELLVGYNHEIDKREILLHHDQIKMDLKKKLIRKFRKNKKEKNNFFFIIITYHPALI